MSRYKLAGWADARYWMLDRMQDDVTLDAELQGVDQQQAESLGFSG